MTSNGASLRTGDLYGTGTISSWDVSGYGSLMELTWNGRDPLGLPDGTQLGFLADGDEVSITATAPGADGGRIDLGLVSGRVLPAVAGRQPCADRRTHHPTEEGSVHMTQIEKAPLAPVSPISADLQYLAGFGNHHVTEAVPGALPEGRNSPQRAPLGLYAEQISGTPFTAPRGTNKRTWVYRLKPSAAHPAFRPIDSGMVRGAPLRDCPLDPNRLRWDAQPLPEQPTDFVNSLFTVAANGDVEAQDGIAVHLYAATTSMTDRFFVNADGEMLLVPESGVLRLHTEMGILDVAPSEIAVVPRGIRWRVELPDGHARGYIMENYGAMLTLPELGPIGANGLANHRDFLAPSAAFEDRDGTFEVVQKYGGSLWAADYDHSPLDVVAWHGNYHPYKYKLANFMVIGTISFDHPDPSIYTVLTSPSGVPGTANADFVIFPPRWLVGEDTFRPPWYHRNIMTEYMGLVKGVYDAKAEGFVPGGSSLHNSFTSHGPDATTYEEASTRDLTPQKIDDTLAFMFETRLPLRLTAAAADSPLLQGDYDEVWDGITTNFER